jgi:hypothetical protein
VKIEHLRAEDVARQQVGGELHPGAGDVEAAREGPREGGLADAGHVFDEHVAAGEHADEQQLDGLGAAREHRGEALADDGDGAAEGRDFGGAAHARSSR